MTGFLQLSEDQVAGMAPDVALAAAGRKLASVRNWKSTGWGAGGLWGECQGSAIYQVRVDLANLGFSCSCPSRKLPCKHVLGLLFLAAQSPEVVSEASPPEWLTSWLAKRQAKADRAAEQSATPATSKAADPAARAKRATDRDGLVRDGLDRLSRWLGDLVRNGLAGLESQPAKFWDDQAKRLVDAQAPGLASRVRRLSAIPGSGRDWPRRLLEELGTLKLAVHAFSRADGLAPDVRENLRQLIGWNVHEEELQTSPDQVADEWNIVGQWIGDEDNLRVQRSWLVGRSSRRTAIVLQFAPGKMPFADSLVAGTCQEGVLAFYPGAAAQRARFISRASRPQPIRSSLPGSASIAEFLSTAATVWARCPWLMAVSGVLHDATCMIRDDRWLLVDRAGDALPMAGRDPWSLLAITGGHVCDLAGEWDGRTWRPLGLFANQHYTAIDG